MNVKIAGKQPKKQPQSPKRREQSRREFLRTTALTVGVVSASLLGFIPVVQGHVRALAPPRRPEDDRGRAGVPRRLHQVRSVRAGLPRGGHQGSPTCWTAWV